MGRGPDSDSEVDGSEVRGGRWGEGEQQDDHKNTLPLVGRVSGQVRLYGERVRGVRGHRETGTTKPRGPRAVRPTVPRPLQPSTEIGRASC